MSVLRNDKSPFCERREAARIETLSSCSNTEMSDKIEHVAFGSEILMYFRMTFTAKKRYSAPNYFVTSFH